MATHAPQISIIILLSTLPPTSRSFTTVAWMRADISLNGDRIKTYTAEDYQTVSAADLTAGYIDSQTVLAINTAFAQTPRPDKFKVIRVDVTASSETYSEAYTAARAVDDDWYGLAIDSRVTAVITALSATVETDAAKLFVFQSDDADWLTASVPAGFSGIVDNERTVGLWHDTNTQPGAVGWAVSRLTFNPDDTAAAWVGSVQGVAALASSITEAQRQALFGNNMNVGLLFGGETFFVFQGYNITGRPVDHIVTSDWFKTRLDEKLQGLIVSLAALGTKLPVSLEGQSRVLGQIDAQLEAGVDIGHFVSGENSTKSTALEITQADLDAGRMRFTAQAQTTTNAIELQVTVYASNAPIGE